MRPCEPGPLSLVDVHMPSETRTLVSDFGYFIKKVMWHGIKSFSEFDISRVSIEFGRRPIYLRLIMFVSDSARNFASKSPTCGSMLSSSCLS